MIVIQQMRLFTEEGFLAYIVALGEKNESLQNGSRSRQSKRWLC